MLGSFKDWKILDIEELDWIILEIIKLEMIPLKRKGFNQKELEWNGYIGGFR